MDTIYLEFLLDQLRHPVEDEQDGLRKLTLLDEALEDLAPDGWWARLQSRRANILVLTPGEGVPERMELAIHTYQRLQEFYERESQPQHWARNLNNLAAAWRRRVKGTRSTNMERSIDCLHRAEELSRREDDPTLWGRIQGNLGNAYFDRVAGDPRANIEQAISHFDQALEVFTADAFPTLHARCSTNLGLAYKMRIKGDRKDNLEEAIRWNLSSVAIYGADRPPDWARTHNNLGTVYRQRLAGNRMRNVETAIDHFHLALEVWTRTGFADDWARVQHNLGIAYRERLRGRPNLNLARSRHHLHGALEVRSQSRFPNEWLDSLHSLAMTESLAANWPEVERIAREVIDFAHHFMGGLTDGYERRRLLGKIKGAKNLGVMALTRKNDAAAAFDLLRQGRGLIHATSPISTAISPPDKLLPCDDEVVIAFCHLPLDDEPLPVFVAWGSTAERNVELVRLPGLRRSEAIRLLDPDLPAEVSWLTGYRALIERQDTETFKRNIDLVLQSLPPLLAPLRRLLETLPNTIRRCRIAPSGPVALVPPTLMLGYGTEARARRFTVSVAAGVPRPTPSNDTSRIRRVGLLTCITDPTDDLPQSRLEGESLTHLFPDARHLSGPSATKERILEVLAGGELIDYLHISCHGRFQWRHAEESGLLLAGGEVLNLTEIAERGRLSRETVVVLPACETGITEFRQLPDESYGLPSAFISAGAGTVISALWPVSDLSTRLLMVKLYSEMKGGASPATALKRAQWWLRNLRREALSDTSLHLGPVEGVDRDRSMGAERLRLFRIPSVGSAFDDEELPFAHPFHWAGFVCVE